MKEKESKIKFLEQKLELLSTDIAENVFNSVNIETEKRYVKEKR